MRRHGRVCALQILYQLDLTGGAAGRRRHPSGAAAVQEAIDTYWGSFEQVSPADREFAERLVHGVVGDLEAIDAAIAAASHHWKVGRMGRVDRNVLRVATYEILHCPEIPRAASINEAIEIAKSFSGGDAAAFVNGILDHVCAPDEVAAGASDLVKELVKEPEEESQSPLAKPVA